MKSKPSNLEVVLTKLAFRFFGKAVYKGYADRLPVSGHETVLDFGCGMGTIACHLSERLPHGKIACLDVSLKWLEACKKNLRRCRNIYYLYGDIYDLPLKNESFDLIFCHFVLHDIPDNELSKIIPVMGRVLKHKGLLAFREPLGDTGKIKVIRNLIEQNGFVRKESRITDVPLMNTTLESIYIKL